MKVNITLIEEEKPFLVAGFSEITKGWVFGFPYFHKTKAEDGVSKVCPCIILPCADDGKGLPDNGEFDFAVKRGEFHPVRGELRKFVGESVVGTEMHYHFKGGIAIKIG